MINSNKQEAWATDIKIRMSILLNGFKEKCKNPTESDLQIIDKVEKIINNSSTNYIIDEYKGLTDESLVKMFDFSDSKYCKVFIMLFTGKNAIYEFQQKQRLEVKNKLDKLKDKYYKDIL